MKKWERLFYLLIIVTQFLLIYKVSQRDRGLALQKGKEITHLYSFKAEGSKGNIKDVRFSRYSEKMYILGYVSADCHHCIKMINDMKERYLGAELNRRVEVMLISRDNMSQLAGYLESFTIGLDDSLQFGEATPQLLVANGKGDILYRVNGYREGAFENADRLIQKLTTIKSRRVGRRSE